MFKEQEMETPVLNRKTLRISAELLADFLKDPRPSERFFVSQKGMPEDARIVHASWQESNAIELTLVSREFDSLGGDFKVWYSQTLNCTGTENDCNCANCFTRFSMKEAA